MICFGVAVMHFLRKIELKQAVYGSFASECVSMPLHDCATHSNHR